MTKTTASLIARRASKGFRADESAALLTSLLEAHSGDNLAHALAFEGFATPSQAARFVASI